MKFELYQIISIAAVISCFIPILIVALKRLWQDTFFLLFSTYWLLGGLANLLDFIPGLSKEARETIGVIYNLIDLPFLLFILRYTTSSDMVKRYVTFSLALFLGFEILNLIIYGFRYDALKYTLGSGIALVLIVLIWEIILYLQLIEQSNRQTAKIFIYAALLFEYGTFIVIYIFDYFLPNANSRDTYLIYYISTLVALFIASCGYMAVRMNKTRKADLYASASNMEW
ncbi:MAG: hypothetical protein ABI687_02660 [Flavitalea sp.]